MQEHFRVHRDHFSFQQLGNCLLGALHWYHLVDWLVDVGELFSWLVDWWATELVGVGRLPSLLVWLVLVGYKVGWCWLAIKLVGWLVLVGYSVGWLVLVGY